MKRFERIISWCEACGREYVQQGPNHKRCRYRDCQSRDLGDRLIAGVEQVDAAKADELREHRQRLQDERELRRLVEWQRLELEGDRRGRYVLGG